MPWPIARLIAANPRRRVVARCPQILDTPTPTQAAAEALERFEIETAAFLAQRAQRRLELLAQLQFLQQQPESEPEPDRLDAILLTLECGHQRLAVAPSLMTPPQFSAHCTKCGDLTRTLRRAAGARLQQFCSGEPSASPEDFAVPTVGKRARSQPSNPTTCNQFPQAAAGASRT
jgi:hypothetical protein